MMQYKTTVKTICCTLPIVAGLSQPPTQVYLYLVCLNKTHALPLQGQ